MIYYSMFKWQVCSIIINGFQSDRVGTYSCQQLPGKNFNNSDIQYIKKYKLVNNDELTES